MIPRIRSIGILCFCLGTATGCGLVRRIQGKSFPAASQSEAATEQNGAVVLVPEFDDGMVVTARLSAGSDKAQQINAGSAGALSGSSVTFPVGAVAIDTSVTVEEGIGLEGDGVLTELGVGAETGASAASSTMVITANPPTDPVAPFEVAIAVSSTSLLLQSPIYFIVYKATSAVTGKTFVGIIPASEVTLDGGVVKFKTQLFGAYQVFTGVSSPEAKQAETTKPIATKRDAVTFGIVSSPATGAVDFDLGGSLTLTAEHSLSLANVVSSVSVKNNTANLSVDFTPALSQDGRTVTLTFTKRLAPYSNHEVKVSKSLTSTTGGALQSDFSMNFKTRDIAPGSSFNFLFQTPRLVTPGLAKLKANSKGQILAFAESENGIDTWYADAAIFDGEQWKDQIQLEASTVDASYSKGAITEDGKACVAWFDGSAYLVRCYVPGAGWAASNTEFISPNEGTVSDVHMVVAGSGTIRAFWIENDNLFTGTWSGGSWTLDGTPLATGLGSPFFSDGSSSHKGPNGEMALAWIDSFFEVTGIHFDGNNWSTAQQLSANGTPAGISGPEVAIDLNGDAVVTWWKDDTSDEGFSNTFSKTADAWGGPQPLAPDPVGGAMASAKGVAVYAWVDGSHQCKAKIRPSGGSWGAEQLLRSVSDGDPLTRPIAGPNGDFLAICGDTVGNTIMQNVAVHSQASGWTETWASPDACELETMHLAGMDDYGNAMTLCQGSFQVNPDSHIVGGRYLKSEGFQAVAQVTYPGFYVDISDLVVLPDGRVFYILLKDDESTPEDSNNLVIMQYN